MNEYLLASFTQYGMPILFFTVLIAAIGLPLPASLLLIAAGALVAGAAAMAGDHMGYGLGYWGGKRLIRRFAKKVDREDKVKEARAFTRRWGGSSVFFSRWLIAPPGTVDQFDQWCHGVPLEVFSTLGCVGRNLLGRALPSARILL